MTPRGLGRGLAALIPDRRRAGEPPASASGGVTEAHAHAVISLPIDRIDRSPDQPRTVFSESELQDLAQSIRTHGILQPLLVTPAGDRYLLVVGERRLKAARRAGLAEVPCVVHAALSDRERLEVSLIENVQREDLTPIEHAAAYRRLHEEFGLTHDDIARAVGKERPTISNIIRLLDLPGDIQAALNDRRITFAQARGLLAARDAVTQREMFEKVLAGALSISGLERATRRANAATRPRRAARSDPQLALYEQELSRALGTRVRIRKIADGGTIGIEYYSDEELSGIVARLTS